MLSRCVLICAIILIGGCSKYTNVVPSQVYRCHTSLQKTNLIERLEDFGRKNSYKITGDSNINHNGDFILFLDKANHRITVIGFINRKISISLKELDKEQDNQGALTSLIKTSEFECTLFKD